MALDFGALSGALKLAMAREDVTMALAIWPWRVTSHVQVEEARQRKEEARRRRENTILLWFLMGISWGFNGIHYHLTV